MVIVFARGFGYGYVKGPFLAQKYSSFLLHSSTLSLYISSFSTPLYSSAFSLSSLYLSIYGVYTSYRHGALFAILLSLVDMIESYGLRA